jgi:hypothetical protein
MTHLIPSHPACMWVKTEEAEKKIEKEISMGSREKIGESESKKYCGSSVVEELGG